MPHYKFSDLAYNITDKKMPEPGDERTYIGLEHLDSGSLAVTRWGGEIELKGQKLVMKKGDILFGRRNTYLRRAAIAPHDGIFSAHGMIFRPKTEVIDPDYFPFFIASDYFMNAAIRISVGSLSPTVNWKTLKELEFDIPTLEQQRESAKILKAANELKESYQALLLKTDDLVKSQFIEMFGDPETNSKGLRTLMISEVVSVLRNGATIKQNKDKEGYPITRIETISDRTVDREKMGYAGITSLEKYSDYVLQDGDILMSHINSITHMGKTALYKRLPDEDIIHGMNLLCLRPIPSIVNPIYLYRYFQMDYFYQQVMSITKPAVNQASMTIKDLGAQTVLVPDLESQNKYVEFVEQSDKSKFELKQAIEGVDILIKSMIQQELN